MKRVRDPRDFWAGVLFIVAGLGAVLGARRYPFGTTASMGPGYFPAVLGWILAGIGLIVSARSLRASKPAATIGPLQPRPVVLVLASVVVFGVALPRLGVVASSMLLVTLSRTAAAGFRWVEVLVFGAALTVFSIGVFVWGLEMPMPLWPPFLRP